MSLNGTTTTQTSSSTTNGSTTQSTTTSSSCTPTGLEAVSCGDKKDNDCDGYSDCNDSDCKNNAVCVGSTTGTTNGG